MQDRTVVLDRDDMRRTLVRIAHEIVEKNPPGASGKNPPGASGKNPPGESGESPPAPSRDGGGSQADPADPGVALVGIHRRGAILAQRLQKLIAELTERQVPLGSVDISFYRDDLSTRPSAPVVHASQLDFPIDGRTIVVVDDVLYTGRTVRAAIDQIFDYGRPARIQLAVLVDRGHRELPIRPDYVGKNIPTAQDQRVNVRVQELDDQEEVAICAI